MVMVVLEGKGRELGQRRKGKNLFLPPTSPTLPDLCARRPFKSELRKEKERW